MNDLQPKIFRWIDFLTFGLAAIIVSILGSLAALTPQESPVAIPIMAATTLGFWLVYVVLIFNRWQFSKRVSFVTRHGLISLNEGYDVGLGELEAATEEVLRAWIDAKAKEDGATSAQSVRQMVRGLFVVWKPFPFTHHSRPKFKFTGLASNTSFSIAVAFRKPLTTTALGHELGHVILRRWRNDTSEEGLKEMQVKYGTPY